MTLDSVREIKALWSTKIVAVAETQSRGHVAAKGLPLATITRSLALGVSPTRKKGFRLAVRLQQRSLEGSRAVEDLTKRAKGEVDVRYVGRIARRALPWQMTQQRPLRIGASVGHHKVTAGTLGCFVRPKGGGPLMILSNNHVLANENRAKKGDPILQPGAYDGGTLSDDEIGTLFRFIKLKNHAANKVDAAVALLHEEQKARLTALRPKKQLKGLGDDLVELGSKVWKNGRTTQVTEGNITAFELDNVVVDFTAGTLRFDSQIEIEGAHNTSFSDGGDSGSMITGDDDLALALLFAGSDMGGSNGMGLTYVNPIHAVLKSLAVELALT